MLNLHQLFDKFLEDQCFLARLDVDDAEEVALFKARKEIRECLRVVIANATKALDPAKVVIPRFFTQGSCAYKTLNDPAHTPPQEIDLDDGVYLPMSLLQGAAPSIACDFFFKVVDTALTELAKKRGWTIDTSKERCTRVRINQRAHIDVPLYAIPDSEYARLSKAATAQYGYQTLAEAVRSDADSWVWLSSEHVWLAIRGGTWEQSDPRKVHEWFLSVKAIFGEQFVRICRYLKAWRDYQWFSGGPSSILLMVCASESFKKHPGRDDLALLEVAHALYTQLGGDVINEEVNPDVQLNNLDQTERVDASNKALALHAGLKKAIQETQDAAAAIELVRDVLGDRIPNNLAWVKATTRTEVVQSTAAAVVPAPAIQRTTAG